MGSASSLAVVYPAQTRSTGLGHRLDAARQAVEGKFLQAGDVLSKAVQDLGELIALLDGLTARLDPETVRATTAELTTAAAALADLPASHTERRGRIDGLIAVSNSLGAGIGDMREHLNYLRVFAINIKITSGGIAAAGPEFALFSQEIYDCIDQGRARLDAFGEDLISLAGALRSAQDLESALSRHCDDLLPAVPDGLTASAAAMAEHHRSIARVALEVGDLARAVRKKIGGALAALQIGDITRQRIEHVRDGLALIADRLEDDRLDDDRRDRLAAFAHGLLAAQLTATADDFHREVSRIAQNMAGMAADASEILRLRDLAHGRSDNGASGFLRGLEANVGRALGLVARMEAGDRTAEEVGRTAAASAQDLGAKIVGIQAIRADVQMMALNTTLKCSRIGDTGKPLAVIAIELRQHAGYLERAAAEALAAVRDLSAKAGALNGGDDQSAGDAGVMMKGALASIRQAGDVVEADLATVASQGADLVGALKGAAYQLDFQSEIGAILDGAAADLADLAGPGAVAVHDLGAPLAGLLAEFAKLYTMAQEREVHQATTGSLALPRSHGAD